MALNKIRIGKDDYRRKAASQYIPTSNESVEGVWVRLARVSAIEYNNRWHGFDGNTVSNITVTIEGNTTNGLGNDVPDGTSIFSTTFSWETYPNLWPLDDMRSYFIPFATTVELTASTKYWLVLDMGISLPKYALEWAMDPDKISSTATDWAIADKFGVWMNSSSAWEAWGTYGLFTSFTNYDTDARGTRYHISVDGKGYMTPDNLHSALESTAVPFTAKIGRGQQEWSDLEYPFSAASWDNWLGGIGTVRQQDRDNGYTVGTGIDTRTMGQIILQPAVWETNSSSTRPPRNFDVHHETVEFPLYFSGQWLYMWAVPIQMPASSVTVRDVKFAIGRNWGAPWSTLKVSLQTDNAGEPSGTKIQGAAATDLVKTITESEVNPMMTWFTWDFGQTNTWTTAGNEKVWLVLEATDWPLSDVDDQALQPFVRIRATNDELDVDEYSGSFYPATYKPKVKVAAPASSWTTAAFLGNDAVTRTWAFQLNMNDSGLNAQITDFVYWPDADKFFCVAGKLYEWTEGTNRWDGYWTVVSGVSSITDFQFAEVFDNKLYVSRGTSNPIQVGTWSAPNIVWAAETSGIAGTRFLVANGFLWTDTANDAVKKYNGTTWSSAITIGTDDYAVSSFALFQDEIHVAKQDGIWYIDKDDLARQRIDYSDQAQTHNGQGLANFGELLYFNVGNSYWRWTGATIDFKGPYDGFGSVPATWTGKIVDTVRSNRFLYAALWGSTTGTSQVLAFNGIGWHPMFAPYGTTGNKIAAVHWTSGTWAGAGAVTDGGRLWFGEDNVARFMELPDRTDNTNEWSGKVFDQYGWIEFPWLDFGLREVDKFFRSVSVEVENFTSSYNDNLTIRVGAYINDGSDHEQFYKLGEFRAGDDVVAKLPPTLSGKAIKVLVAMETRGDISASDDIANVTPVIRAVTVEGILRPPQTYVHSCQILLGDIVRDMYGKVISRDTATMWNELKEAEASSIPLKVEFPWGGFEGFISSLSARTIKYEEDAEALSGRLERIATISFIEAKN